MRSAKYKLGSPRIDGSEGETEHRTNDSTKTGDVKVGGLSATNGLVRRPNGYVNGTFYEL